MKELLTPVSSSNRKVSVFTETERFNFLDGTVCLVHTDVCDNVGIKVYKHQDGQLTEGSAEQDEWIAEEDPPVRSEEKFSTGMALQAALDLGNITGENPFRILERMDPSLSIDPAMRPPQENA